MTVESPCIRNCCLNHQEVCLGCFRTLHEITQWTYLDTSEKQAVIECASARKKEHDEKFNAWNKPIS
jgi:hypothetical protein